MNDAILFGWNADLDIPSAISLANHQCVLESHILISAVDSSSRVRQMPSLLPLLQRLQAYHRELGDGLIIEGRVLLTLIEEHDFFDGFDEMWFFEAEPSEPKPEAVPLTSDVKLAQPPAETLVSWMCATDCIAGLGDGDGLNFATFRPELAECWSD